MKPVYQILSLRATNTASGKNERPHSIPIGLTPLFLWVTTEIAEEMLLHPSYFAESYLEIDAVDDLAEARKQRKVGVKKMKEMGIMMVKI